MLAGRSNPHVETVRLDGESAEALGAFQIKAGLRDGLRGVGSISTEALRLKGREVELCLRANDI